MDIHLVEVVHNSECFWPALGRMRRTDSKCSIIQLPLLLRHSCTRGIRPQVLCLKKHSTEKLPNKSLPKLLPVIEGLNCWLLAAELKRVLLGYQFYKSFFTTSSNSTPPYIAFTTPMQPFKLDSTFDFFSGVIISAAFSAAVYVCSSSTASSLFSRFCEQLISETGNAQALPKCLLRHSSTSQETRLTFRETLGDGVRLCMLKYISSYIQGYRRPMRKTDQRRQQFGYYYLPWGSGG